MCPDHRRGASHLSRRRGLPPRKTRLREDSRPDASTPSVWLDPLPVPTVPPASGDILADVAVVGGGVTGVAAAYCLARGGARVVLLERRVLGAGATGRNAGFLLHGLAEYYAQAVWYYGRTRARAVWEFSRLNHGLLDALVASEAIACGLRRAGSWSLACSPQEAEVVRRSVRLLREDGFDVEEADPAQLPGALRAGSFHGAALNRADGEVDPAALVRGLAAAAARAGARIFEGTAPASVNATGRAIVLRCGRARVRAGRVVLASNAWTPQVRACFAGVLTPVRAQMLALAPVPERLFDRPAYANHGYEYWRQLPDGRILLGGGRETAMDAERGYDETPTAGVQRFLDAYLARRFPVPAGTPVTHRWAGLMAFTPDGLPLVGEVPDDPRICIAAGYNGHGMGLAVAAARGLADLILGRGASVPDLFSPARFARRGGWTG